MKTFKFKRGEKAEEFYCVRCERTKKSKNTAYDGKDTLCNGCYGLLLSRKLILKE